MEGINTTIFLKDATVIGENAILLNNQKNFQVVGSFQR